MTRMLYLIYMNTKVKSSGHAQIDHLFLAYDKDNVIQTYNEALQILFPEMALESKKFEDLFDAIIDKGNAQLVPKSGILEGQTLFGKCYDSGAFTVVEANLKAPIPSADQIISDLQNSMDSHNRFLITTTHELKSPISVLLASSEYLEIMLKDIKEKDHEVAKCFSSIKESCFYLSSMVDDLMDVASFVNHKINLKLKEVDLSKIVRRIAIDTQSSYKDYGCEVNVEGESSIVALVDPIRFEQAVTNLIINACKYGESRPITVKVENNQDHVNIAVTDQGIGIKKEDFEKIFLQFSRSTTLHQKQSFGIGLFVVKAIVEAHKGEIEVESQVNKGSTFSLKLPLKA